MTVTYPGGLAELEFVEAYCASALRKPSVVADAGLRTLVLAGQGERHALSGLIAEQLAEACRRLAAVYVALADRRHPIARALLGPLPGAEAWLALAQDAGVMTPEQTIRHLSLDDSALEFATRLRSMSNLGELGAYVAAAHGGTPMFVVPAGGARGPQSGWLSGPAGDGGTAAVEVRLDEREAAALADLTADLCGIARGFLGTYISSRRRAGRRE
jgi:hypothetical protein